MFDTRELDDILDEFKKGIDDLVDDLIGDLFDDLGPAPWDDT